MLGVKRQALAGLPHPPWRKVPESGARSVAVRIDGRELSLTQSVHPGLELTVRPLPPLHPPPPGRSRLSRRPLAYVSNILRMYLFINL